MNAKIDRLPASTEATPAAKKPDILAFQIAVDGDNDMKAAWLLDHEHAIRAWLAALPLRTGLDTLPRYSHSGYEQDMMIAADGEWYRVTDVQAFALGKETLK